MRRPAPAGLLRTSLLLFVLGRLAGGVASAQEPPKPAPAEATVGQFFTVVEPINDAAVEEVRNAALPAIERAAAQGKRPTLVFEIRPGQERPGQSSFGSSSELATFLATRLRGAQRRVAYVPEPLSGYAVLAALACDEIVLGPEASLGPITPEGGAVTDAARGAVADLAKETGRDPNLLLGMLDPDLDLREVRTADRQVHYVRAADLDAFRKGRDVAEEHPAWEGGRRGVLTAERARRGLAKFLADDRARVAEAYGIANAADDPTLSAVVSPVLIRVEGPLDTVKQSYLERRIRQAQNERANLVIFDLNSEGGLDLPAVHVADAIVGLKGIKTIAFVDDRATQAATLVALACDEIVLRRDARIGDLSRLTDGRNGQDLGEALIRSLSVKAEDLARRKGHPVALARAMVDPAAVVSQARDAHTGAVTFVTREQADAEPGRFALLETVKEEGGVLTLDAPRAAAFGVAARVVDDLEGVKLAYGLRGKALKIDGPTWVDTLVATLNTPWMSWLLLFVGMFMLILELKLPGVGLPAITSALAFLLFFWGKYLGGTADQLEILLFLVGLVCLALELFVFPGFGVFGLSGILMILASVIMASHTFVWPSQDYEYRQMGRTLFQVTVALVAVGGGAVALGRYFPSLPLFNRMVLMPEPLDAEVDPFAKPAPDPDAPLFHLIGEVGRTTTPLKPTGRARFGDLLVDVYADGFFIEANHPVEVIEVRGSRVTVKKA